MTTPHDHMSDAGPHFRIRWSASSVSGGTSVNR
jgi:hypothetical protein